jgi:hypothetical protein
MLAPYRGNEESLAMRLAEAETRIVELETALAARSWWARLWAWFVEWRIGDALWQEFEADAPRTMSGTLDEFKLEDRVYSDDAWRIERTRQARTRTLRSEGKAKCGYCAYYNATFDVIGVCRIDERLIEVRMPTETCRNWEPDPKVLDEG